MRLSKEERWQLKLIRLVKEVRRRNPENIYPCYAYDTMSPRYMAFTVWDKDEADYIIDKKYQGYDLSAREQYEAALYFCKREGLI